ncbi:MAG: phosphoribosylformylglycinamidine synthase, partial [Oscillospiraceae bacterium]|nr:phosphoribosylformylglycinamidine synthase [Oscillospiraceae bacterium]
MSVFRVYVEKKPAYAVEAQSVLGDVRTALRLDVTGLRILNRYDADRLTEEDFRLAIPTVFSEPAVDDVYESLPHLEPGERMFAVEYLPGQFDQRADSCEQCISLLTKKERCRVRNARIYIVTGDLSDADMARLKKYLINPVESREATLETFKTLDTNYDIPTTVDTLEGFIRLNEAGLNAFIKEFGLAMDLDDIRFCQDYFKNTEHRDPTITEIRMIDTYWSDHCRHTTFLTNIQDVDIPTGYIRETYDQYLADRKALGREDKPLTLMDLATMGARVLKAQGKLN